MREGVLSGTSPTERTTLQEKRSTLTGTPRNQVAKQSEMKREEVVNPLEILKSTDLGMITFSGRDNNSSVA